MDNVSSPSPPKRSRIMETVIIQQGKSNQFLLPKNKLSDNTQQPKFTKVQRLLSIKSKQAADSLQAVPYSSTMKFVPNKEISISNKLQKLRLKSPDGRDLGEINVKLFPQQVDNIGGKTITLKKQSVSEKMENQQAAVSILKPMNKKIPRGTLINVQPFSSQSLSATGITTPSITNCVSLSNICAVKTVQQGTITTNAYLNTEQVNSEDTSMVFKHFNNTKCTMISNTSANSKVILVKVDKPGVTSVQSAQEDVRNLVESAIKPKVVMVRAENYPHLNSTKKNTTCSTLVELRSYPLNKESGSSGSLMSSASNSWKFVEVTSKATNQGSKTTVTQSVTNGKYDKQSAGKKDTISGLVTVHENTSPSFSKPLTIVKTYGRVMENGAKSSCDEDVREPQAKSMEVTKIIQRNCSGVVKSKPESTQCVTITKNNAMVVEKQSKERNKSSAVMEDNLKTKASKTDKSEMGAKEMEQSKKDKNIRENIMVILHEDADTLSNNKKSKLMPEKDTNSMEVDVEMAGDANLCLEESQDKEMPTECQDKEMPTECQDKEISTECQDKEMPTEAPKLDKIVQENNADILAKALSTLPDQEMREKALKALADCGIGIKRQVPVPPTISVNDSQTQTRVFSLFEPDTLIELSEDSSTLNRLQVTERSYPVPKMPCENNLIAQQQNEFPHISGEDLCITNALFSPNDFSSLLADFIPETATNNVNKITGLLSKPDPKVVRIFEQLKKDHQAVTTTDSDGFSGIHKAVLSGNIREVKRLLLVLKALKEDIDFPTGSGKTSLELAVLCDVDPEIVRCLLREGAKPAFPMKLHESALILACKMSSVVIPDLIKHVDPPTLLDILDSEGFAPLHYCAQRGNSDAVKMLVSAGANVNLRDAKSGRTPLFHALENHYIELAWHLVENGASLNITNFAGQSPAALVDEYRHNALAEKFNQLER